MHEQEIVRMEQLEVRKNVIYARQSLDIRDSLSIDTQLAKCKSVLEPDEKYQVFIDRGYSGKNIKRPDLQNMMQEITNGGVKRVLVYRLDRFSRSILDFAEMWDTLEKHHVEFLSVNEHFDTSTPIGKAMVFIIVLFAQMERETIAERITDNYYDRVKTGRWPGGPAPWGCRLSRLQVGDKKIPTLEYDANMDIMEELYYRYHEENDMSLGQLAKELIERGIPGPRERPWNNVTLARLFRNPAWVKADADIYTYFDNKGVTITNDLEEFEGVYGCILVGKRESNTRTRREMSQTQLSIANWAGRIPSGVWLGVQNHLAENRQIGNAGKGKYTWLSGLIKCGYCNRALVVGGERKDTLYCSGYHQYAELCDYGGKYPSVPEVEEHVEAELLKVLNQCENQPVEEVALVIDNEDKLELIKIEKKIEKLMETLTSDEVSALTIRYVNRELEKLHEQHKEISDKIVVDKRRVVRHDKIQFEGLELEAKKVVARGYIEKVLLFKDQIEIVWLI